MTLLPDRWIVRVSDAAARDIREIYLWTAEKFGEAQAMTYAAGLSATIAALEDGPNTLGAKHRDDLSPTLSSIAVKRRRSRHVVYFRIQSQVHEVLVFRILHTSMDPSRHIPGH